MKKTVDFLLIGGGLASAFCAETLRKEAALGSIVILSEESILPYFRPQLPKSFLLGKRSKEQIVIFNESYYKKNDIEVMLNTKVLAVDPEQKRVKTDKGGEFYFNQLLIATGCSPIKVDLPGNNLAGIHYLKTILDAQSLIHEIEGAKSVVIFGGSFIGIEIASLLIKKNIKVTVITEEFSLFNVRPSVEIGTFLENHGVEVLLNETIKKFNGKQHVQSVETSTGKILGCDFVLIAGHNVPDTDFLHGSGIKVENGVVVDMYLQTNKAEIYAAGDVAQFFDPVFRKFHRNGGSDNAMKQGNIAARNMLGMRKNYSSASYFFFRHLIIPLSLSVIPLTLKKK